MWLYLRLKRQNFKNRKAELSFFESFLVFLPNFKIKTKSLLFNISADI